MRVSIGTSSQSIGSRKPATIRSIIAGASGLGVARQAEGEAQQVDVVDRGARPEDLDQPRSRRPG